MNKPIALRMLNSAFELELPIGPIFVHLCEKVELIEDQNKKWDEMQNLDEIIIKFATNNADCVAGMIAMLRIYVVDNITPPIYQPFSGVEITEANSDEFNKFAY